MCDRDIDGRRRRGGGLVLVPGGMYGAVPTPIVTVIAERSVAFVEPSDVCFREIPKSQIFKSS